MHTMKTGVPAQKVTAGVIAGALTTILVWVLNKYANVKLTGEISAAITTLLSFAVSYIVPPAARDGIT